MTDNKSITVIWPPALNEDDSPMLWLGTWLVGTEGMEGDWCHSGRGEAETEHQVPESVTGMRLRKWPNEGLAPEYADVIPIPERTLAAESAIFEREQPFSLLGLDQSVAEGNM